MKVVVVGKGGREHALAQALLKSSMITDLWICPGNSGMQQAGLACAPYESIEDIENFCVSNGVSLVVIGPEIMILSDLKPRLEARGISCFAPSAEVAQLESSKLFCKGVLKEAGVKTAACQVSYSLPEALKAVDEHDFMKPLVVKADGLAQGKGVWVCESKEKAREAVRTLSEHFSFPLLLEECLQGPELSAFALCDGEDFVVLGTACDYKRISSDPFSANTGGMGAYSPCDFITPEDHQDIHSIFAKTLAHLNRKKMPYQGFLFAGLMKTAQGLYVLEYNVRMGDPETQALLPRLRSDLTGLIVKAVTHQLKNAVCELSPEVSVHVVAASEGYPSSPMKLGSPIQVATVNDPKVDLYFAGVSRIQNELVNVGGRVLGVTALAETKLAARSKVYQQMAQINFEGMYLRQDIGL